MIVTDQMNRVVTVPDRPQRIISLVPSQTEYLFDIGLADRIVGVTRYCTHPVDAVKAVTKIGGTKQFDMERIAALNPDLIIGNKEENYVEGIAVLEQQYPVWMSHIVTLEDSYQMMQNIGIITGCEQKTTAIIQKIKSALLKYSYPKNPNHTCAYMIWRKPYMVAAGSTFIHEILQCAGYRNVFADMERYPEISPATLGERCPDLIFLSSEPYSFSERHYEEFQSMSPNSKVILVDGELFSWYGSRLQYAPQYWAKLEGEIAAMA